MTKEEQLLNTLKKFLNGFYDDIAHRFTCEVDIDNRYVISQKEADLIKNWLESK